jgi:hypothetical protein
LPAQTNSERIPLRDRACHQAAGYTSLGTESTASYRTMAAPCRPPMPRAGSWTAALTLCVALLARNADAAGQKPAFELRAGVITSSALAQDEVANPSLIALLGDSFDGPVRAEAATAPIVQFSVLLPLRQRTTLDIAAGWTFSRIDAVDAAGRRDVQRFGAGQLTLGIRYAFAAPADAGCGFGMLRYFADGGLFEGGTQIAPLVECGAGVRFGGARGFVLRAIGQAHRFRTPVLRDAGAQTGSVLRMSVQAGIATGARR